MEIPHDALVVTSGLSGSGKSSLAFGTVFAEGQRRYIETFSPYTRQFFDRVKKPDLDSAQNVRPAIAIQQRTRVSSSRSTVGSITDLNNYLRILWSNFSIPHCPACNAKIKAWQPRSLRRHLEEQAALMPDRQFFICAEYSLVPAGQRDKKASKSIKRTMLDRLTTLGFSRVILGAGNQVVMLEEAPEKALLANDTLLVVIDRISSLTVDPEGLEESLQEAFTLGQGCLVLAVPQAEKLPIDLPTKIDAPPLRLEKYYNDFRCSCQEAFIEKPRPYIFSYNHPLGACPDCKGFGKILDIDEQLCVPDVRLSLEQKAIKPWAGTSARGEYRRLLSFCKTSSIPLDIPFRELTKEHKDLIFNASSRDFKGLRSWFKKIERKAYKMHVRVFLARYRTQITCPTCQGFRLRPSARAYRIDDKMLPDIWAMPVDSLLGWVRQLYQQETTARQLSAELCQVFSSIITRLEFLNDLGLCYLTLDRQARTLSGGETQRVNLVTALGSELVSTQFVLDEPSVGLHPRDSDNLMRSVNKLVSRGNSVLLVEHDPEILSKGDFVIELGPEAGERGGEIVFCGPVSEWKGIEKFPISYDSSSTYKKLKAANKCLKIEKASYRNLKNLNLEIPLNHFVCLSGVSGSGKTTLTKMIEQAYSDYKQGISPAEYNLVSGFENILELMVVDQSPLVKSPRANIATYSKLWDEIRVLLSRTQSAKSAGLTKSAFSFNVEGGRCPECKGAGYIREDMQFLSDVLIPCEICLGQRFGAAVLEVQYCGKNVDDLLKMSVDELAFFLRENEVVWNTCQALQLLGLGHLRLGHPLSELSGGEAQRLKIMPYILKGLSGESYQKAGNLFIFDEPTTGLHPKDIQKLLTLFERLKERGHSIFCVEHNLNVLLASDLIVDLGPEGGQGGGFLMALGTPAELLKNSQKESLTAAYMKRYLKGVDSRQEKSGQNSCTTASGRASLQIKGAREHNLKGVDLQVPLGSQVSITGVSGSGKSTIAKDIIYAEGQRRYLDCLSPYARQFIKELKKPAIDSIANVQPTVCVHQHTFQPTRLSTLATMSEAYNFLRLLYAKVGTQYCPVHREQRILPLSAEKIVEEICKKKEKDLRILAPVVKQKKGLHREVFERALSSEVMEVRVDGVFGRPFQHLEGLEKNKIHTIEYTIARLNTGRVDSKILEEAVNQALTLGAGSLIVNTPQTEEVFSTERSCPICKQGFFRPDPEDLSFNSKRGACSSCAGRGRNLKGELCPECSGSRLKHYALSIRLADLNIYEFCQMSAPKARDFLENLDLDQRQQTLARPVFRELLSRLKILTDIGLDYIELNRDCSALSSGELQRLRLSASMGTPLTGAMYIFDEPSAGLHPQDNKKVVDKFQVLRERDNTVLIIEHDIETILSSDHIIEVGPGGGREGGEIVFNGSKQLYLKRLQMEAPLEEPRRVRTENGSNSALLEIKNGCKNNLNELNLSLPMGRLVVVAGVSGAGKSSLVHGIICETFHNGKKSGTSWKLGRQELLAGHDIDRLVEIDQKPIGATSRSTPASYLGIWDEIRALFARTVQARSRGWTASYFSYNTGQGRCPECKGQGQIKLEMSFLADAVVTCPLCQGSRYKDEALSALYLDLSVSDVLNLTFSEARKIFANHRKIHSACHTATELGLGYLTLGQSSATLSGGESQRIKLVSELKSTRKGHSVYILDEPTTGLHRKDVARLIKILKELVTAGSTVIVIEHDPDMILAAEHMIELGPGAAQKGGKVIFSGAPYELLNTASTPWGRILKPDSAKNEKKEQFFLAGQSV